MRDAINELNKHSIAEATGISYNKLRKFAVGITKKLTPQEQDLIYEYLTELAERFNNKNN